MDPSREMAVEKKNGKLDVGAGSLVCSAAAQGSPCPCADIR